jgi:hypothetical protein
MDVRLNADAIVQCAKPIILRSGVASNAPAVVLYASIALRPRFGRIRRFSLALVDGLSDADASAQSMPDASPSKWHLAHITWLFETFILRDFVRNYVPFDHRFAFLYNSYYEAEGDRIARRLRGLLTRPSLDEIRAYRPHVDAAIMQALDYLPEPGLELVVLGRHHEEQHQELLLTDVLHLFAQNPLLPAAWALAETHTSGGTDQLRWIEGRQGPTANSCPTSLC